MNGTVTTGGYKHAGTGISRNCAVDVYSTICNLFIQVYLIKRFLFKPVNEMLEKTKSNGRCRNPGCYKGEGRSSCHEDRV